MAQIVFNHVGRKPLFFDGTSFDYWKRKMKMYLGSINEKVWDVTEHDFVILDPTNPTAREQENCVGSWCSANSAVVVVVGS